ncbi:MAG: lytic transglycosylase domain-containing protein [Syntrophorhabdaceae bacterium]|nr:lytic transglycosylase domain-containing protein [Syntrophorhabdaceae bacterium]
MLPTFVFGGIYGYVDERGVYHFTNVVPVGKRYHVVIPDKDVQVVPYEPNQNRYDSIIHQYSSVYGIDPHLVKAVMKAESNFNPYARSKKGAQGLMQIMPETANFLKIRDPYSPDDNIEGGIKYLKFLDEVFQGNLDLVLAAYNAGPKRVMEHNMRVPPIEETRTFIKRVKENYRKIKKSNEG